MWLRMIKQQGYSLFDLFIFFGVTAGIIIGSKCGYGNLGVAGAVLGGAIGALMGWLPYAVASYFVQRSLEKESVQQLRDRIRSGNEYFITPLLLAHLLRRGENVADELPFIIELIKSDSADRRRFGWAALKFAFPEIASEIPEFRPHDSTDKCRTLASHLNYRR